MPDNEQLYSFAKKYQGKKLSPLKSIRGYCRDQCSAGHKDSWQNCAFKACLLWKFRFGVGNRLRKGKQVEKQGSTAQFSTKEAHSTSEKEDRAAEFLSNLGNGRTIYEIEREEGEMEVK